MVQTSRGWNYLLGLTTRDGSITKEGVVGVGGGVVGVEGVAAGAAGCVTAGVAAGADCAAATAFEATV
jgi:hypothetical protein